MVNVFTVEPGSNESVTTRLRSSAPRFGAFGLKGGKLAIASTSPVRGSSATAIPESARERFTAAASARSAESWMPWSIESSTRAPSRSCPAFGACARTTLPAPSRSDGIFDDSPRSTSSRPSSTPSSPSPSSPTTPRSWLASSSLG